MKKWLTLSSLCLAFFFYMSDRQLFGLLVPLIFAANACMSWAPTFVAEKFHLDMGTVGKGVMFGPNLAAMVFVIGAGFVTDWFVRRFPRFRLALQSAALLLGAPIFVLFGFSPSVDSGIGVCLLKYNKN